MNLFRTLTVWHYARPAGFVASALLLSAVHTSASAQLLASSRVQETPSSSSSSPIAETVSLKSLLKQWEGDYHVTIFYESTLVGDKRVPLPTGVATLENRLNAVLPPAELAFKKLRDDYFVVTQSSRVSVASSVYGKTLGQDVTVSGRVTSEDTGEGLPGVTVLVKGTSIGASTNADGSFTLNVPENSTLIISSVGFVSKQITITGPNPALNVQLAEDVKALSEVVVVGYGTQARQELTTAVSSVSARDIERQPVAGFDQALQGLTPGVQVTAPSGAPGAGINVRIRGNSTIGLNGSPLYVIDGIPILPDYQQEISNGNQRVNPLNALNPNDIESIDILKDGAAAAIYGVRASNGVVVITTKHGKVGKAQVGLNVYYGSQSLRKQIDVLNARQFADYYNDASVNAAGIGVPYFTPTEIADLAYDTNWQDQVYRTAPIESYQLNVSGATDKTRYYLSGGYFKQEGISLNSGFDRYSFKLNLDQQLSDHFRAGTNLTLSRTNNNGSVRSEQGIGNSGTVVGALAMIPIIPVRNADGTYSTNPIIKFDNPVGNLLETHTNAIVYQAIGNVFGELDILKNLRFRSSLGLDFRTQNENQFITRDYPGNSFDPANPDKPLGRASTAFNQQVIWLVENTLTYNPNLGERHNLTLLAGQSAQESNRNTSGATVQGFTSNLVPYLQAGATAVGIPGSYADSWGLLSYFGRATYAYDDRYLLTLSMRADGSSRFAKGKQFGYFPAASVGWRISKESFFPQGIPVSDLKIRGSFGANGNQEIYAYQRFPRYQLGGNYQGNSGIVGGVFPLNIGNEDISWETTYQSNVGLDVGMLEGRLTLTVDAYLKRTKDLLLGVDVPLNTGAQELNVIQNIGRVENKGLEVGLNTTNVKAVDNGFSWTTNFNVTMNRNKVLDLGKIPSLTGGEVERRIIGTNITQVGSPLGSFYGLEVEGVFQSQTEIDAAPTQANASPGDLRFRDVDGDGKIDILKDRTVIGNPNPKAIAGVTNTFTFKGLDLSIFFQGSFGNDIYNQNRQTIEGMDNALNQSTQVLNRWRSAEEPGDGKTPRAVLGDPNGNNTFSSRFIEDGSYVRLKNLTLGYNFTEGLIKKAHMSNLRLYVTGQNVLTWTDYSGYDPEVSADPFSTTSIGRDFGVYPQSRTYIVGLNATF